MPRTRIIVSLLSLIIALPAWAGDINLDLLDAAEEGNVAKVQE